MEAIHPGEHLAEELKEIGISADDFARQISMPTNRVTQILNGCRSITGDTSLRLAHFFGTSAECRGEINAGSPHHPPRAD